MWCLKVIRQNKKSIRNKKNPYSKRLIIEDSYFVDVLLLCSLNRTNNYNIEFDVYFHFLNLFKCKCIIVCIPTK